MNNLNDVHTEPDVEFFGFSVSEVIYHYHKYRCH